MTDFELEPYILPFLNNEPFWGSVLRKLKRVKSFEIDRAGVKVQDDSFILLWNPEFFETLTTKQIYGVLKHELMHVLFNHLTTRSQKDKQTWWFACDYAINSLLDFDELPENCLRPGKVPANIQGKELSQWARNIGHIKAGKTAEHYYNLIFQDEEFQKIKEEIEKSEGDSGASPKDEKSEPQDSEEEGEKDGESLSEEDDKTAKSEKTNMGQGGNEEGDEDKPGVGSGEKDIKSGKGLETAQDDDFNGESSDSDSNSDSSKENSKELNSQKKSGISKKKNTKRDLGYLDNHEEWETGDKLNPEIKEYLDTQIKNYVKDAVDFVKERCMWGNVPAVCKAYFEAISSNKIRWQALLKAFLALYNRGGTHYTFKKINRKYPYQHPGPLKGKYPKLVIAIDQSGSISSKEIQLFFSELNNLAQNQSFTVIFFDTEIDVDNIIKWKRYDKVLPRRNRSGGTNFSAAAKWINNNRDNYDGLIMLTDGQCSKPVACKCKRIWVISPGNHLNFETKELTINMENE